jgi:hypothetical protein
MVQCFLPGLIATLSTGLLLRMVLISMLVPNAAADSVSNDDTVFLASPVSEAFLTTLNEPSFSSKTARPEPVKGIMHVSDSDDLSFNTEKKEHPLEKALLDPADEMYLEGERQTKVTSDNNIEHVEKPVHAQSTVVYDHSRSQDSSEIPEKNFKDHREAVPEEDMVQMIGSTTHAASTTTETLSIPIVEVDDPGLSYSSLLYKADGLEQFEHRPNNLVHEVSRVSDIEDFDDHDHSSPISDIEDFDDRSLLDVFGEVAKEYLTQRVVSVMFIVIFHFSYSCFINPFCFMVECGLVADFSHRCRLSMGLAIFSL